VFNFGDETWGSGGAEEEAMGGLFSGMGMFDDFDDEEEEEEQQQEEEEEA
jgi:hypothetical protein